jgi:AcrR family transcriptional regulator
MKTPTRILRGRADDLPGFRPFFTDKQLQEKTRILAGGLDLMAAYGRNGFSFRAFAIAIRLSPAAIRHHFVDLDELLVGILHAHFDNISSAIGKIPRDTPNRQAAVRAAYLAVTRTQIGYLTQAHLLLIRDSHLLPADLFEHVERLRIGLASSLAPYEHGPAALGLLDSIHIRNDQIEAAILAIIDARPPEIASEPEHAAQSQPSQPTPALQAVPTPAPESMTPADATQSRPTTTRVHPKRFMPQHPVPALLKPTGSPPSDASQTVAIPRGEIPAHHATSRVRHAEARAGP